MLRRLILLAALAFAGPVLAQAPPVPPVADADRYQSFTVTSSTPSVALTFPVYGDGSDLVVKLNGAAQPFGSGIWTFSSVSGTPIGSIPRPITDGLVTFTTPPTSGTIEIIGAYRPRVTAMQTAAGIARREFNQSFGQVVSTQRELYRALNQIVTGGQPPFTGVTSQWPWQLNPDGTWVKRQPFFTDVGGTIACTQMQALTGEVVTVGCAATIANKAVVFARMQDIPANTVIGNVSGSTGTPSAVSATTTVNGQACQLGGTCTIVASAGGVTVGTTAVTSGTANCNLYNNAGLLGCIATVNSGVYVTNGSGVPSISTTLPNVAHGTPTSMTATNVTGLPILTGVSGLGTGVATALAVNVGSVGAPLVNGGVLGTPSSATLANATGLPIDAGTINTLPLARGGSANTTAAGARGSAGYNVDNLCTFGDANYTVAAACRQVQTTVAFTAPRTLTLPAANSGNAGQRLAFKDAAGAVGATNTLTIARAGSDLVNGGTTQTLNSAYSGADLDPDGVSKWTYTPVGAGGGSGTVTGVTAGASLTTTGGAPGGTISTSGTVDLAQQTRGNLTMDRINIAKALGTAQRGVGVYSDGFKDTSGIAAGSSSNYSCVTASGYCTPTFTTNTSAGPATLGSSSTTTNTWRGVIAQAGLTNTGNATTVLTFSGPAALTLSGVYIGASAGTTAPAAYQFTTTPTPCLFSGGSSTASMSAGGSVTCTAIYTIPASGNGILISHTATGNFNTGTLPTNWTEYYLGGGGDGATVAPTGYTSFASAVDVSLVQSLGMPNNMILVSTPQALATGVPNSRAAFVLAGASLAWGTDATIEVTNNGGTNWTAATPVIVDAVQNGNLWEIPDTTVTTGTSFQYRFKTLTNKAPLIYGASQTVH